MKKWQIEITKKLKVTSQVPVGITAMILGLAVTVGWLPQEVQAARCLFCDTLGDDLGTGPNPTCPNGVFSCPPWAGGQGILEYDEGYRTHPWHP
jgi:hypothetical protein